MAMGRLVMVGGCRGWQVVVDGVEKRKDKIVYKNEFETILSNFGTTFNKLRRSHILFVEVL